MSNFQMMEIQNDIERRESPPQDSVNIKSESG